MSDILNMHYYKDSGVFDGEEKEKGFQISFNEKDKFSEGVYVFI